MVRTDTKRTQFAGAKRAKRTQFRTADRPGGGQSCETNPIWPRRQVAGSPESPNVRNEPNLPPRTARRGVLGAERAKQTQLGPPTLRPGQRRAECAKQTQFAGAKRAKRSQSAPAEGNRWGGPTPQAGAIAPNKPNSARPSGSLGGENMRNEPNLATAAGNRVPGERRRAKRTQFGTTPPCNGLEWHRTKPISGWVERDESRQERRCRPSGATMRNEANFQLTPNYHLTLSGGLANLAGFSRSVVLAPGWSPEFQRRMFDRPRQRIPGLLRRMVA